jgi:hypothetical protein
VLSIMRSRPGKGDLDILAANCVAHRLHPIGRSLIDDHLLPNPRRLTDEDSSPVSGREKIVHCPSEPQGLCHHARAERDNTVVGEIIRRLGWMGSRRFMNKPSAVAGVLTIDDPKHPSMFEEPQPTPLCGAAWL